MQKTTFAKRLARVVLYFLFAQSIFCRILLNALLIRFRSVRMELIKVFVLFKRRILFFARKKVYRNVGTVVGDPFHIGEDINKVYAHLNLAYSALSPVDMYRFKLLHKPVHDLLKGLDADHILHLHSFGGFYGKRDYLAYCIKSNVQLSHGFIREAYLVFKQSLGSFKDIYCIIADPLVL